MSTARSKMAPASVGSLLQRATAASHAAPLGARGVAREVCERGLVRRDHAGARAGLDGHVADGHALVHRHRVDGRAAKFEHVAGAAGDADLADDGEDQVLGGDARRKLAVDIDRERLRLDVCSRHCVASTWPTSVVPMPKARAPNAPCVEVWLSPQTIVLPGCVIAKLRPDDVHDAAAAVLQVEQLDAELLRS